ncbi:PD-(D/E)XK nuclease family protein [Ilumatobacter sp.]|uniref:PD-(D/E)XK nuclease family protein n=1 Tax=Ilumatobacter sp. TaxID=1967498 RepID=UPI003B518B04
MAFDVTACSPADAVGALARAVAAAKGDDAMAQVTVVVPTNATGVMARRALGNDGGVLGVDMVTLNRLAELIAGPALAHAGRRPVSTPLLELVVRQVLDDEPGSFASVASHPATIVALREAHQELRLAGDDALDRLRASARGREVARVSASVTERLRERWYDESDLLDVATRALHRSRPAGLAAVVLHVPDRLDPRALELVRALGSDGAHDVGVVVALTGDPAVDVEQAALAAQLGVDLPAVSGSGATRSRSRRVVSTTDADDEVRIAIRSLVDAARGVDGAPGVAFERMAILWPARRPYARLVEHHLTADGIPWNGRGGTELTERIAPRLVLDLLDLDRRGLRRQTLFELFADVPLRDAEGRIVATAEWERASRAAGISRDEDWVPRLSALARRERWSTSVPPLLDFVADLRATLGHPLARRRWTEWVDWSCEQVLRWLGPNAIARFDDDEYRAWEAMSSTLERLRSLDEVAAPVDRATFRTVFEGELRESAVRRGRVGTGVTVGSLVSAIGLDLDIVAVLGVAEGMLPPAPSTDALLSNADRERAGLVDADRRARRLHHAFVATTMAADTIVTFPRGDLRATTANQPSRWLSDVAVHDDGRPVARTPSVDGAPSDPAAADTTVGDVTAGGRAPSDVVVEEIDSATAGLAALAFAPCERERRLGERLRSLVCDDSVVQRGREVSEARELPTLSEFDGDLSSAEVPLLAEPGDDGATAVSPTRVQAWAACPHAYFVRHLLGVTPLDDRERRLGIEPHERGNLIHDALDAFHRDVIAGTLAQPTDDGWVDEHREALLTHFATACASAERRGTTGRPATWARDRAEIRSELLTWLDRDGELCRATGVTVLASERGFPRDRTTGDETAIDLALPDGRRLLVQGTIDRLDRRRDGTLVVTDHKTGKDDAYKALTSDDPTLAGTVFQLPTYAAAALRWTGAHDATAVRAEYSMFERGGYRRHGFEFDDEVWDHVAHDLGEVVAGIEQGWFPATPPRPGFSFYTVCPYCDPDDLGTTDTWARWVRKRGDERIARWFAEPAEGEEADDG